MKQEFITWKGKIIIENNILYIRSYYFVLNWQIIRLILSLIFLIFFVALFFENPKDADWKTKAFIWSLTVCVIVLPTLYETLLKQSYSNAIPLNKIESFQERKDAIGYKTFVILRLKSGRLRTIKSRTFEKQHEQFIAILSQYISQPQIA